MAYAKSGQESTSWADSANTIRTNDPAIVAA